MKQKESGFTLIELLVALGVIVMLLAVFIPNFNKYREKALLSKEEFIIKKAQRPVEQKEKNYTVICIEGYKFIEHKKSTFQLLDTMGRGIRCE